jgi:quinolinate synthase
MSYQQPLDEQYHTMSQEELARRVKERKAQFGSSLCILGHHYQRDEVVALADFVGDSLKLSQQAASTAARYIVFCGVHFMAESADVLSSGDQVVCLPNMLAGCAMADMADADAFATAMGELRQLTDAGIIPITYVNSTAAIKALTARSGGACCTSSNCRAVFEWAIGSQRAGGVQSKIRMDDGANHSGLLKKLSNDQAPPQNVPASVAANIAATAPAPHADKIFALPDEHLARNTALAMGYSLSDCVLYDPALPQGGLTREQVNAARFILWKGHCYVHQRFKPEHVEQARRLHPGINVMVHPECPHEVVSLADYSGSTEQIIRKVTAAPAGSSWAIGTESNLVTRLARQNPGKFVRVLSDTAAICAMMHRIDLPHLLWTLDNLAEGKIVNQVSVPNDIACDARVALRRMIEIC